MTHIRALVFDVFGTVVDWRGSITRGGAALSREWGVNVAWGAFADAWHDLLPTSHGGGSYRQAWLVEA